MNIEEMSREELVEELRSLQGESGGAHKEREMERVLQDLRVHQVELELQNIELRETQAALEESRSRFEELYDFAPIAYYTFDVQGCVQEVNLTGATMVGWDRARLIGKPFLSLVRTDDRSLFWAHLKRCAAQGRPTVSEMRIWTERSGPRDLQVTSAPVLDTAGRAVAFRTSFTDISERKAMEAELARKVESERVLHERFEALDRASLALNQVLAQAGGASKGEILQVVVDEARRIVDCEFAAFGVADDPEGEFSLWTFSGMDQSDAAEIEHAAHPTGVLGEVVRTGEPVRLRDLREHPTFGGFPPNHPEMRSLLGVCVRFRGCRVGNLYLTNKLSADEFTDDDQRIAELFAERAGVVMELCRLAEEVQAAVDARDNLLAVVSHDLRSPLSAIQLSAKLLSRKKGVERRAGIKQVEVILRAAKRMNGLIEDLLQASTIEAGAFTVTRAPADTAPLVNEAIDAVEPVAAAGSIRLIKQVPPDLPPISCDPARVLQVLANLLGNALKFVPPGGIVQVRVWAQEDAVHFAVSDSGPGIPEERIRLVFDRYWKGQAEGRHGTGLGLFISRGIVEAHGGQMLVESVVGQGTTFSFTLPISDVQPQAGAPAKRSGTRLEGKRVLIADDDASAVSALASLLRDEGLIPMLASSGHQALARSREAPPDIVVLDVRMPGMGGLELLQGLREHSPGLPAVIVSGLPDPGDCDMPGVAWLPKPIDVDALVGCLARLVHDAETNREDR